MELRYGLNPGQAAYAVPVVAGEWPVRVLNGEPSFINLLDALNGWQLLNEASQALPFRDNVDQAARHGVRYVAEPGGSVRSGEVEAACREYGIGLSRTGVRLFQH